MEKTKYNDLQMAMNALNSGEQFDIESASPSVVNNLLKMVSSAAKVWRS